MTSMTAAPHRIVHLSDVHFGREQPALARALIETVTALRPQAVVLTGDFTQRARRAQFRAAAALLAALPKPLVIAPGNHDVPLYNLPARLFAGLGSYRDHLSMHGDTRADPEAACIVALDSTDRFTIQGGRLGRSELARARDLLAGIDRHALKIVALHHPPVVPPGIAAKKRLRNAGEALREFEALGIDVILSGHTHRPYAQVVAAGMLSITAGSAISDRHHDHGNSFFRLDWTAHELQLVRFGYDAHAERFMPHPPLRFARRRPSDAGAPPR
jgi:3',5'-cyclic AMP phosphodiesterase CpdA